MSPTWLRNGQEHLEDCTNIDCPRGEDCFIDSLISLVTFLALHLIGRTGKMELHRWTEDAYLE